MICVRQGGVWQDRQSESSGPQLCGASTTTIGLRRRYGTWGITLIDMTELQDPKPAADRVRHAEDLVESLLTTVVDTVPHNTDVALLGGGARLAVGSPAQRPPTRGPLHRSRRNLLCCAAPVKTVSGRSRLPCLVTLEPR
jgi:hypothetical protein